MVYFLSFNKIYLTKLLNLIIKNQGFINITKKKILYFLIKYNGIITRLTNYGISNLVMLLILSLI